VEEKDIEKNSMMQRKRQNNHRIQPQAPLEVGRAIDVLASVLHAPTTCLFIFVVQNKKYLQN
jgi:hypothetical protein